MLQLYAFLYLIIQHAAHNPKNEDVCHYEAPTNLTIDVRPKSRSLGLYFEKDRSCEVTVKAILPVCTSHQPYDKITIAVVSASDGRTCSFDDYNDYINKARDKKSVKLTTPIKTGSVTIPFNPSIFFLPRRIRLSINSSHRKGLV